IGHEVMMPRIARPAVKSAAKPSATDWPRGARSRRSDAANGMASTTATPYSTWSRSRGGCENATSAPSRPCTMEAMTAMAIAPSEGDVLVDGVSVRKDANTVRARCGFVTDQPSLYERMPLRRYLGFFARLYDVADPDVRAAELAKLLGLDDVLDRKLATFSRGMRQKVAIARALVHDPPVLLLDEPATALDPEMSQMLRRFIVSLRARHRAILLTTHDLDEAQRIADRVVVLYKGKVLRTGATADIRAAGRPSYTVSFAGDAATAR